VLKDRSYSKAHSACMRKVSVLLERCRAVIAEFCS